MLGAVLGPLDRSARPHRCKGNQEILRVEFAAHAEAAPHIRLHEVDAVLRQLQQRRQHPPVVVRHLRLAPHRQLLTPRVIGRGQPPRFHRIGRVPVAAKLLLAHVVGITERRIRVADRRGVLVGYVGPLCLVDHGLALQRFFHVHQSRKQLVHHLDCLCRILGQVAALRQHHGQRVAHVVNLAVGKGILQEFQQVAVRSQTHGDGPWLHRRRDVLEGDHISHARHLPRRAGVDGQDPGVGMGAANNGGVKRVRQLHIVYELPPAHQEPPVFPPPDGCANVACSHIVTTGKVGSSKVWKLSQNYHAPVASSGFTA